MGTDWATRTLTLRPREPTGTGIEDRGHNRSAEEYLWDQCPPHGPWSLADRDPLEHVEPSRKDPEDALGVWRPLRRSRATQRTMAVKWARGGAVGRAERDEERDVARPVRPAAGEYKGPSAADVLGSDQ